MSPAPALPARAPPSVPTYSQSASQQRGTSPVSSVSSASSRQPMVVQNGPQVQQQLSQQMQALSLYQSSTSSTAEPPPPYPLIPPSPTAAAPPPPSYTVSLQNRQSPTQDFRKSPSSGIYSGGTSAGKFKCEVHVILDKQVIQECSNSRFSWTNFWCVTYLVR